MLASRQAASDGLVQPSVHQGLGVRGRRACTALYASPVDANAATTRGLATPRADSAEAMGEARPGDDDCLYCGDFEEDTAHYLDLDDEWGITRSAVRTRRRSSGSKSSPRRRSDLHGRLKRGDHESIYATASPASAAPLFSAPTR